MSVVATDAVCVGRLPWYCESHMMAGRLTAGGVAEMNRPAGILAGREPSGGRREAICDRSCRTTVQY
jgi:hypothetical protein